MIRCLVVVYIRRSYTHIQSVMVSDRKDQELHLLCPPMKSESMMVLRGS